jgi:hypothetical protein
MRAPAANAAFAPDPEDVSFCDVVTRLCPRTNYAELFACLLEDRRRRHERVRRLRERARAETYRVRASAVARALLRELDPGWPA